MNKFLKHTILIMLIVVSVFSVIGCTTTTPGSSTADETAAPVDGSAEPTSRPVSKEKLTDVIMREAQIVADFMRDNDFFYGDASINPGINWAELDPAKAIKKNERIVSCDRLVTWILYRVGFVNQPYTSGETCYTFTKWCEDNKFIRIDDKTKLQAGDVIFVNPNSSGQPTHMFMTASTMDSSGRFLRYDAGSDARIQCKKGTEVKRGQQPFIEPIDNFMYAYRPTDAMLDIDYPDSDTEAYVFPKVNVSFEVKYATPSIDGKIADGEYKSHYTMDKNTCDAWQGKIDNAKAEIYFAWDDKGLYYAGQIFDSSPKYGKQRESWSTSDALQLGLNPGNLLKTSTGLFFTFGATDDNKVIAHRANFDGKMCSKKVTSAASGHVNGSDSYIIEVMIPWDQIETALSKEFKAEAGASIGLLPCVLDYKLNGATLNSAYRFKTTDFNPRMYVPATLTK